MNLRGWQYVAGVISLCVSTVAAADFAYIINDGPTLSGPSTVSVINTNTNTVVATIGVGDRPRTVAANPQTRMVYVANQGSGFVGGDPGSVSIINGATNTVVATLTVPGAFGVATSGNRAYVAGFSNALTVIQGTAIVATIAIPGGCCGVGAEPIGVAVSPSGARVYTANFIDKSVSVIDAASLSLIATIPLGDQPQAIAINPAGTRIYTANLNSLSVIDTATNSVTATIAATAGNGLSFPQGIAVNPAGTLVYATNSTAGSVSVFDAATNGFVTVIGAGSGPQGVSFTFDGSKAYVADKDLDVVHVIDVASAALFADVPVGVTPISVGSFMLPGCGRRATADFNGNGTSDFAVFRQPTGQWFNTTSANVVFGVAGEHDIPVTEDYDGDCKADNAYWAPNTGTWNVRLSSNGTTIAQQWGAANLGDIPVPADYDGDGKADFAVYRQSTGQWFRILSGSFINNTMFGVAGENDVPVPGDYDADGKADVAYWAPNTGTWNIRLSSTGAVVTRNWGLGSVGDVPVPGDYDGDGKTDFAVYRQPTGQWFTIRSATNAIVNNTWGVAGQNDIPVPGDYDNDGKTDLAYWNPVPGTWNILLSAGGTIATSWGTSSVGDIPLEAPFAYVRSHF